MFVPFGTGLLRRSCWAGLLVAGVVFCPATSEAVELKVRIDNLAPSGGVFFTPVWIAFHDGSFDVGDLGSAASVPLERLAEDGNTSEIAAAFAASSAGMNGGVDDTVTAPGGLAGPPVFDPGESVTRTFDVDPVSGRYFLYASMIIPSNDAFFAELDALSEEIFDAKGNFLGPIEILILGSDVLDAGTEDNTELEAAFLNQSADNTGDTTVGGVISAHPGFNGSLGNPGGVARILGGTNDLGVTFDPLAADFTQPGSAIARIVVVPEVPTSGLMSLALVGALVVRRWGWLRRAISRSEG